MRCGLVRLLRPFFFNDTATTEIYTLSLHDALPISLQRLRRSPTLGIGGRKGPWHPGCDPQSSPKSRSPSRGTLRFSGTPSSEPFLPSCSGQEGRLPCFVWKGFPTFRSHLRMRPVSRRHSRRGLVGGSTFRRTPISRSPLDKNPMPGHLSELQPVNAVNTKGQSFRASFGKNPRFQIQLDKRPLPPGTSREAGGVPCLNPRRGLTLLSQSAGTLRSESEIRGTLRFLPQLEMRPSSNAPSPVESREAPPTSSFPGFSEPP